MNNLSYPRDAPTVGHPHSSSSSRALFFGDVLEPCEPGGVTISGLLPIGRSCFAGDSWIAPRAAPAVDRVIRRTRLREGVKISSTSSSVYRSSCEKSGSPASASESSDSTSSERFRLRAEAVGVFSALSFLGVLGALPLPRPLPGGELPGSWTWQTSTGTPACRRTSIHTFVCKMRK